MTRKTKLQLRALAEYLHLRIKYVALPPKVTGFLDPSKASRTIVVNANKSKSDHVFTILHEIAHYLLHFNRSHRPHMPWYLNRKWKSRKVDRIANVIKRVACREFNAEKQADIWAFCALLYIGAKDDIRAILVQYPEKTRVFYLCAAGFAYAGFKCRVKRVFQAGASFDCGDNA